jgi:hypothetical protein
MNIKNMSIGKIIGITLGGMVAFIIIFLVAYKMLTQKKDAEISYATAGNHSQVSGTGVNQAETVQLTKDIVQSQLFTRDQQLEKAKQENDQLKLTVKQIVAITDRNNKAMIVKISALEGRIASLENTLSITTSKNRQVNIVRMDKLQRQADEIAANQDSSQLLKGISVISVVGERAWIKENGIERSVTIGDSVNGAKKGTKYVVVGVDPNSNQISLR